MDLGAETPLLLHVICGVLQGAVHGMRKANLGMIGIECERVPSADMVASKYSTCRGADWRRISVAVAPRTRM